MNQKIDERVEVSLLSQKPTWIIWKNRTYQVEKIGLHHIYREGRVLYHVFSVITKSLFMRLVFNTENLIWKLEEIDDSMPN